MKNILILSLVILLTTNGAMAYDVIYNKKTGVFHNTDCHLARNCTKNCVVIDIDEAFDRGATPCEKCREEDENFADRVSYDFGKWLEKRAEKKALEAEKKAQELKTPGVKKQGNFSFTVK